MRPSPGFIVRTLTTIILGPLVIWAVHAGGFAFSIMVYLAAFIMMAEWYKITRLNKKPWIWAPLGIFYIAVPTGALIWLRSQPQGELIIYWLVSIIWSFDIGMYLIGANFTTRKILPKISPRKTWGGFFGGVALCIIIAIPFYEYMLASHMSSLVGVLVFSVALGCIGFGGDIFESIVKRRFNVKDSGVIIPGHGGMLDRMDSTLFAAPVMALYIMLFKPF